MKAIYRGPSLKSTKRGDKRGEKVLVMNGDLVDTSDIVVPSEKEKHQGFRVIINLDRESFPTVAPLARLDFDVPADRKPKIRSKKLPPCWESPIQPAA